MLTVSQLCDLLALETGIPFSKIQRLSRELINSGFLPKASGRAVPDTSMHHRANFLLALAASEAPDVDLLSRVVKWEDHNFLGSSIDRINAGTSNSNGPYSLVEFLATQLEELAVFAPSTWLRWETPGMRLVFDWTFGSMKAEYCTLNPEKPLVVSPANYQPNFTGPSGSYAMLELGLLRQTIINPTLVISVSCGVRYKEAYYTAINKGALAGLDVGNAA